MNRYLEEEKLAVEVEEKKETEAQSCLDRIWYSLSCSARFDLVIIANTSTSHLLSPTLIPLLPFPLRKTTFPSESFFAGDFSAHFIFIIDNSERDDLPRIRSTSTKEMVRKGQTFTFLLCVFFFAFSFSFFKKKKNI